MIKSQNKNGTPPLEKGWLITQDTVWTKQQIVEIKNTLSQETGPLYD